MLLSLMALREAYSYQPPAAYTGAPFDNGSCRSCHSGGSTTPTITLLANGTPVNGTVSYAPGGGPVNMEVRVNHSSASVGGFELTVATLPTASPPNDGTPASGLTAGSGSTLLTGPGGRKYLGHQGTQSFSNGQVSWFFTWTPPASDLGTLRWYIAANAANGDGSTSGDATATATFDMPADLLNSFPTETKRVDRYYYDPIQQAIVLIEAGRAELFTLDGRMTLSLSGKGPHPVGHLSGIYLLRLYSSDGGAPVTTRLWLP